MRTQESRLSLSASEWWWEACPVDRNNTRGPLLLRCGEVVPCVSFGDDAVGQTFRKKAAVGFLSDFENEFTHRRKLSADCKFANYLAQLLTRYLAVTPSCGVSVYIIPPNHEIPVSIFPGAP